MNEEKTEKSEHHNRFGLIGAILAAIAASVCCLGPLVLLGLGVSGAWISSLSALEAYRPLFMAITFVFLGFAFYKVYKKPKAETCEPGSYCGNPKAKRISKIILWVVTVLIVILLTLPYVINSQSGDTQGQLILSIPEGMELITLDVKNMTCAACTVTVTKSLKNLEGIKDAKVSLEPPQAFVVYDPAKVDIKKMTAATANVGYPSSVIQKGDE